MTKATTDKKLRFKQVRFAKRELQIAITIILASVLGIIFFNRGVTTSSQTHRLDYVLEIADEPEEHRVGLSQHESLGQNEGMLFVYEDEAPRPFWMMGMSFSIDIIWMNKDFEILHIEERIAPETYQTRQTFDAPEPSMYVLEVNAGHADRLGLKLGDRIEVGSLNEL